MQSADCWLYWMNRSVYSSAYYAIEQSDALCSPFLFYDHDTGRAHCGLSISEDGNHNHQEAGTETQRNTSMNRERLYMI